MSDSWAGGRMRIRPFKHNFLDILIGWQGAAPGTRSLLLQVFCSDQRLQTLISNAITLLIIAGLIVSEPRQAIDLLWLAAIVLSGLLPRVYAAHLRRHGKFDQQPEAKALTFVAISAVYGVIWGIGPFLLLPSLSGNAVGILLIVIIFGTIMGPDAAMPGILYVRLVTTGLLTLTAIAIYTTPQITLAGVVLALWLTLRTEIWRGYHRTLRQQLELREAIELRQLSLERANEATEQTNRTLKVMAETDPLTGAANRRHFMRYLENLRGPAALILIDVDHFKVVNDHFGHQVGDTVLVELVSLTGDILRKGDLLARLGGDEFAAVLPDMDSDGAWNVAERLREAVERHFHSSAGPGFQATVSLGIAVLAAEMIDLDPSVLLQEADAALYAAKREGRNRTLKL